jgi:hypothetical protein
VVLWINCSFLWFIWFYILVLQIKVHPYAGKSTPLNIDYCINLADSILSVYAANHIPEVLFDQSGPCNTMGRYWSELLIFKVYSIEVNCVQVVFPITE